VDEDGSKASAKSLPSSIETKRTMIEPGHSHISLRQQCELIGLHRSSWYYQPAGESAFNLQLMRLIDEQYLRTPFYGTPCPIKTSSEPI